jgi:hypothetical protein
MNEIKNILSFLMHGLSNLRAQLETFAIHLEKI